MSSYILGQEKKKGSSPDCISMWTHFCRIALHGEPNFLPFFLVARKKMKKKMAAKGEKKKKIGPKHYKKRIPTFRIARFLKKKKRKEKKKHST